MKKKCSTNFRRKLTIRRGNSSRNIFYIFVIVKNNIFLTNFPHGLSIFPRPEAKVPRRGCCNPAPAPFWRHPWSMELKTTSGEHENLWGMIERFPIGCCSKTLQWPTCDHVRNSNSSFLKNKIKTPLLIVY